MIKAQLFLLSIKPMKMMDWSVATANAQSIGSRDGCVDPDLGISNRCFQIIALGKTCGNGGRQRTSGAVGILSSQSRRSQRDGAVRGDEIIDAFAALPVSALDQD